MNYTLGLSKLFKWNVKNLSNFNGKQQCVQFLESQILMVIMWPSVTPPALLSVHFIVANII